MAITIDGKAVQPSDIQTWLSTCGITLQKGPELDNLKFFIENCNAAYNGHQHTKFLMDFRAMYAATAEYTASSKETKAVRELFQNTALQASLATIANSRTLSEGSISFVNAGQPLDDQTFRVGEKHVAISRMGRTNLYTDGFSGCMAVILTPSRMGEDYNDRPTVRKGGLMAHIAQQGAKPEYKPEAYLMQIIGGLIETALKYMICPENILDVTLLVGEPLDTGIYFQGLQGTLKQKYGQNIGKINDLRWFGERAHQFVFRSETKELVMIGVAPDVSHSQMKTLEVMSSVKPEKLEFSYSKLGLDLWVLD